MRLYLEPGKLQRVAAEHAKSYGSAQPFPHAVIDGVFPEEALDDLVRAFPDPASDVWKEYDNYHEQKLETQGEDRLGDNVSLLLYQFNSAPFLTFLEQLTGIRGLIPDPYFSGGGLHQIVPGGKLGIHADFSRHPTLSLERRLNALIFLNRDWKEEYGGHLELWDRQMTRCVQRIAPVYNRMVVFSTTDWSYHGHPHPLQCPKGLARRSVALYYFTVDRPDGETIAEKESTLFMPLPGEKVPEDVRLDRGADYTGLKADHFSAGRRASRAKRIVRELVPPVFVTTLRKLRKRP